MSNLKRKLSSRKFWCAVAAYITSLLTAFNFPEGEVARVVLIISGIGALVAYIFGESIVDAANKKETGVETAEPGDDGYVD
ncbi:MAG: hypothetical protein FWD23_07275 [Oscillospiraceae bacterium]|nr:hypothetical protein [Oscillospiraceae bacterium]